MPGRLEDDLLKLEKDIRVNDVEKIISHNPQSKEYKVCFKDGTVDYITILDDNHLVVREFRDRELINIESFDADSGLWMKPIWEQR